MPDLEDAITREWNSMASRHTNRLRTAVALGIITQEEMDENLKVAFLPREYDEDGDRIQMPFHDAPIKLLLDDGSDTGPLIYISGSHYQRLIRTIENAVGVLDCWSPGMKDPDGEVCDEDVIRLLAKDLRGVVDKSYKKVYSDD